METENNPIQLPIFTNYSIDVQLQKVFSNTGKSTKEKKPDKYGYFTFYINSKPKKLTFAQLLTLLEEKEKESIVKSLDSPFTPLERFTKRKRIH
jgi:hypothetical protein